MLIKLHSYTPDEIASMTRHQMLIALKAIDIESYTKQTTFRTYEEYLAWKSSGNK